MILDSTSENWGIKIERVEVLVVHFIILSCFNYFIIKTDLFQERRSLASEYAARHGNRSRGDTRGEGEDYWS